MVVYILVVLVIFLTGWYSSAWYRDRGSLIGRKFRYEYRIMYSRLGEIYCLIDGYFKATGEVRLDLWEFWERFTKLYQKSSELSTYQFRYEIIWLVEMLSGNIKRYSDKEIKFFKEVIARLNLILTKIE